MITFAIPNNDKSACEYQGDKEILITFQTLINIQDKITEMANFTNLTQFPTSKANPDHHMILGVHEAKCDIEFSEGYLLDSDDAAYLICHVENCSDIKIFKDYKSEVSFPFVGALKIEKTGDKATEQSKFIAEYLLEKFGTGKDNPFMGFITFGSLTKNHLKIFKAPIDETLSPIDQAKKEGIKEASLQSTFPVLDKLEKLDKLKDIKDYVPSSGGGYKSFGGGGVVSLKPSEKWNDIKPLLGIEANDIQSLSLAIEGMKNKDSYLEILKALLA